MVTVPYSTSNTSAQPYMGSLVSVTSISDIRYEGIIFYLNSEDSTFVLKDVILYGTEGRKEDGPQIPPSNKVYEYILFRFSDIKDLELKASPQEEEPTYNDPAIVQSKCYMGPSNSTRSVSATGGSLTETEFKLYRKPFASNAITYPSILPSHDPEYIFDILPQSTHSAVPSCGVPTKLHGCSGGPGSLGGSLLHFLSSTAILHPLHDQTSTTMAMANLPNNVALNSAPTLTPEQTSTSFTDSPFRGPSLPIGCSTLIHSGGLAVPFPLNYLDSSSIGAQHVEEVFPGPLSSPSSSLGSISRPCLRPKQVLLTPNQSSPSLSEKSPISQSSLCSPATAASQSPSLQPEPSLKLQYPPQTTEEFDFEAMKNKFMKDEEWGYLGKANHIEKVEGQHGIRISSQDTWNDNPDMSFKSDPRPAYRKDEFFDTVSYYSPRDGWLTHAERMRMDAETFGDFEWGMQSGCGRHSGGRCWLMQ